MSTATAESSVVDRLLRLADKLLPFATPEETAAIDEHLAEVAPEVEAAAADEGKPAPTDPLEWLRTMFPTHFLLPFAEHHKKFWHRVWAVERTAKPEADIEIWPRGGGKTTNCEAAVVMTGVRGKRKYVLYVRRTQKRADDSVANIAQLLGTAAIAEHYPQHARRWINQFGKVGEWRRNRVRTAGGLVVDAMGLDTAARGAKVGEDRPDLIIIDDIDEPTDSVQVTQKKLLIIKSSIIPAGSRHCWILGVQNLIKRDSVFSQLADGSADFLADRVVNGPVPAIRNLKWEWGRHPRTGHRAGIILGGEPTWEGQNLATCQQMVFDSGIATFLKECNHDVLQRTEGIALRYDAARHTAKPSKEELEHLVALGRVFGGVDFGFWRFGFTLFAVDRAARVYRLDEYFAQNVAGQKGLSERARAIWDIVSWFGLGVQKPLQVWGDAANPTDIYEINKIFKAGWLDPDTGEMVKPKIVVVAVANENKVRKTSVDRLNELLDSDRLLFCEIEPYEWRHHQTVDNPEGTPLEGSRLTWEMDHWSFPVVKPGETQDQDPDDGTADGADLIASMRYAVMSYWKAAPSVMDFGKVESDRAQHFDVAKRQFVEPRHAMDLLTESSGRRTGAVRAPRLRIGKR